MKRDVSIKDQLFIVLLLKGEVLKNCQAIQKEILEHYNVYKGELYPELHITLDRIYKEKLDKAVSIISSLTEKSRPVKIELDRFSCYRQESGNFLVLKIKESETLKNFTNKLHRELKNEDISTVDNYDQWEFHITILSNIFAGNPISNSDFESLCFFMEGDKYMAASYSDNIEIWSPVNEPGNKCLHSFELLCKADNN